MKRLWLGSGSDRAPSVLLGASARQTGITHRMSLSRSMSAWEELIEDAMQGIIYSNAPSDVGAAIANQMVPCGFDLRVTILTLSLQPVANANRDGRMRHVFGLVSDPAGAARGVSVTGCAI